MGKLLDWLRSVRGGAEVGISASIDTDVESHSQEVQGIGRKITVKKGAIMNIDNSTQNIYITASDIPTDEGERAKLAAEIKKVFTEKKIRLISQSAATDIQDYNSNPVGDEVEASLNYISRIAPEQDILCMKTGLYVRSLNERGRMDDAKRIKDNASRSVRARNIINLASAGFIEGYVVPICRAGGDDARKIYNEIVERMPGTVFVNAGMGVGDTMDIIEEKIKNRELYHWEVDSISVNGLNNCVKTIERVRDEIKRKYSNFEISYSTNESAGITSAELKIRLEKLAKADV